MYTYCTERRREIALKFVAVRSSLDVDDATISSMIEYMSGALRCMTVAESLIRSLVPSSGTLRSRISVTQLYITPALST